MSESYQTGNRYFKVDEGYDKKLYENTWGNVVIIITVFIVFYVLNIVHFYGSLAFGTVYTVENMWYNIALFVVSDLIFSNECRVVKFVITVVTSLCFFSLSGGSLGL